MEGSQKDGGDINDLDLSTLTLQDSASEEQLKKDIEVVSRLEDFCSSGEFTQLMQEFGDAHAQKFEATEEQSIECYELYKEYCKMLDSKLDEFLKVEGIKQEELFKSCQRVQHMDSYSLMCLDWILASTEYIEFVYMMLEFKGAQDWNGEDYEYNAGETYQEEGEDDEQA